MSFRDDVERELAQHERQRREAQLAHAREFDARRASAERLKAKMAPYISELNEYSAEAARALLSSGAIPRRARIDKGPTRGLECYWPEGWELFDNVWLASSGQLLQQSWRDEMRKGILSGPYTVRIIEFEPIDYEKYWNKHSRSCKHEGEGFFHCRGSDLSSHIFSCSPIKRDILDLVLKHRKA